MNTRLHCLTLPVDDLRRSLAFYRDGLGFTPRADAVATPETDHIVIEPAAGPMIVLTLRKDFADFARLANLSSAPSGTSECILSVFTGSEDEVDSLLASAQNLGGTLPRPACQHPWGYGGYLADPDGHLWEILWNPSLVGAATLPLIPESDYGLSPEPFTVRLERALPGPIERVWEYLTDPAKRATWFAGGPMELRIGGAAALRFDHRNITAEPTPTEYLSHIGAIQSSSVTACDPPRLLAFTWGDDEEGISEVTFELHPQDGGVRLVLTHRRLPDRAQMLNVSGGWHIHLDILEDRLHDRATRPFWSNHARLTAEYARRFPEA